MQNSYKAYTLEEAKRKLERYCAYQERCHADVREKLRGMRMIPQAIDEVITHLIEHDFLNEERFARLYARSKHRQKSWGRLRIQRELKARDISHFNIRAAMKEIPEAGYLDTLDQLARKKLEQLSGDSILRKKRKLADYLLYRGWENDLVYSKVHELIR